MDGRRLDGWAAGRVDEWTSGRRIARYGVGEDGRGCARAGPVDPSFVAGACRDVMAPLVVCQPGPGQVQGVVPFQRRGAAEWRCLFFSSRCLVPLTDFPAHRPRDRMVDTNRPVFWQGQANVLAAAGSLVLAQQVLRMLGYAVFFLPPARMAVGNERLRWHYKLGGPNSTTRQSAFWGHGQ